MASVSHKSELVARLLEAKAQSGKTFSQIAVETGLTNAYVGQLFHRQAQLQSSTAEALRNAVPALTHDLLLAMMEPPRRSFDPSLLQDPTVYRFHEAVMHYGETFKAIINEEFGDGIMSGIGFYCTIDKAKGKDGEDRVVVTFNGKYLPHVEQKTEDIVKTIKSPCT